MANCEKCSRNCTEEIKIAKYHKGRLPIMGYCINFTPKFSKADQIRHYTDEQLADFILDTYCYWDDLYQTKMREIDGQRIKNRKLDIIDWLQSETE